MVLQKVECNVCQTTGFVEKPLWGKTKCACFACGTHDVKVGQAPFTIVGDCNDIFQVTCKDCGAVTTANFINGHPEIVKSPVLANELYALDQALRMPPFEHRPLFCAECGSQNTETAWINAAIRKDEYVTGKEPKPWPMHATKNTPEKIQPEYKLHSLGISWNELYAVQAAPWNYGGLTPAEAVY